LQAAAQVVCPVSLVVGEHDQMTPAAASTGLAKALNAQTIALSAGHALMGEVPDGVLAAIRGRLPRS
ncbi:MAG: alpha/beta hydrolase, partial [Ideonella sp.]